MKKPTFYLTLISFLAGALVIIGCGSDNNPVSQFEPEITNLTDSFAFQITDAANVTTTLTYYWTNTGSLASIDHSTVTTKGSATLTIFDSDSSQVYSSGLVASANEDSNTGTPGIWIVKVDFTDYSGTANFRIQKK